MFQIMGRHDECFKLLVLVSEIDLSNCVGMFSCA